MGGQRSYLSTGGFSEYLYHQVGETVTAENISGKIIEKSEDNRSHEGLPLYSNTSKVYFKLDDQSKSIEQARIYDGRKASFDFDWGHTHREFEKGIVHVHEWYTDKHGKMRRRKPRAMSDNEITIYGKLLKKAYPDIVFKK